MKKIIKCTVLVFVLLIIFTFMPKANTCVEANTKITYKLKKGTLTIKGKGAIKKEYHNKKIKKVIIKKGITKIPKSTFSYCKNMKSIKIPSTVKTIGISAFEGTKITSLNIPKSVKTIGQYAFRKCKKLKTVTISGNINVKSYKGDDGSTFLGSATTIKFSTDFNYYKTDYFDAKNLQVSSKDSKYKSIDGIVYTKDGKKIVRVATKRKTVNIAEGCETFCLEAIRYAYLEYSGDTNFACYSVNKIVLPSTLKNIDGDSYKNKNSFDGEILEVGSISYDGCSQIINNSKHLTSKEYCELVNNFGGLEDKVEGNVTETKGMYTLGNRLLMYKGNASFVNVPEGITSIETLAFQKSTVKKVKFPSTLNTIGIRAFENSKLQEVTIPKNVTAIGYSAFFGTDLKSINIPDTVKSIDTCAFGKCSKLKTAVINLAKTTMDDRAFEDSNSVKFTYKNSPNLWITGVYTKKTVSKKKTGKIYFAWNKVIQISGYQVKTCRNVDYFTGEFKKNIKTYNKKPSQNSLTYTIKKTKKDYNQKLTVYIKVRPYTMINGKKVYGKWKTYQAEA